MKSDRAEDLRGFLAAFDLPALDDLTLLNQALCHRSYSFELGLGKDNERLEFLGDTVLGFVTAKYIFNRYPQRNEGELSKLKALLVSRTVLGKRARELGLGTLILLGKGEEQSGGRSRPSVLGSALEAVIGALYLQTPFEVVERFICNHLLAPMEEVLDSEDYIDYKSRLQEVVQKQHQTTPEYFKVMEAGPDHNKHFAVEVFINGQIFGKGYGSRKKMAENLAAKMALENISRETKRKKKEEKSQGM
ncbi:MAG: ribonuclease III [bacterium]